MKKILTLLLILALSLPAAAQVGRYKSLKTIYPGYSLKFDTASGELAAMRLDEETGMMKEEIISEKQSHGRVHDRQMGTQGIRGRQDWRPGGYSRLQNDRQDQAPPAWSRRES